MENQPAMISSELFKMPKVDLSPYQMNYNKSTMSSFAPRVKFDEPRINNSNNNQELVDALLGLIQVMTNQQINVGINMNGRTLATATAPFMKAEIEKLDRRKSRLAGK